MLKDTKKSEENYTENKITTQQCLLTTLSLFAFINVADTPDISIMPVCEGVFVCVLAVAYVARQTKYHQRRGQRRKRPSSPRSSRSMVWRARGTCVDAT